MIEQMRRHVAGHDGKGRSIFTDTGIVPPTEAQLYPGATYWLVWGTPDGTPQVGGDLPPVHTPFFPQPGGTRVIAVRFAPRQAAGAGAGGATDPEVLAAMRADAEEKFPGLFDAHAADPEDPAFHTTDTVDYAFVVEGELYLKLDDGAEDLLQPGSFVVQRGTRHAWENRSDEPALVLFVIIGAERAAEGS
ncbi:cupin domain-containing protein [Pseudonocardia sp. NPDC049154]|uniref:cupin domain-containing protein n=1 Tax=Pseudonocardia sp. NPDC049154 TaxID=3155501 RepID=UPI0033DB4877